MKYNQDMEEVEKFFAFQHHGINADIISVAKIGEWGFPVGAILNMG